MTGLAGMPPETGNGAAEPLPAAADERRRRVVAVSVIAALLVAGVVVDRTTRKAAPLPPEPRPPAMATAGPPGALTTSWFCPGATAAEGGAADGAVVIANPSAEEVHGTVTVVPSDGDARTVPVTVAAASRTTIRHRDVAAAPFAAALVELDAGDVVVDHTVSGPLGLSAAPCHSAASRQWHFAEGSTAREDTLLLAVYNPFPDDAIVDLTFATSEGAANPQAFRGLVVRGGRLLMLNVGDHVRRRDHVATSLTARTGRVVVDKIQLRNTGGRKGLSLTPGAPSAGRSWYFPDGYVADGVGEVVHLFNPGEREATVEVSLALDQGDVEPFEVAVPAGDRLSLDLGAEERVPRGVGHGIFVQSLNDVPVVAERTISAAAPAPRAGVADVLGARDGARQWVLAAGAATDTLDQWVIVQNLDAAPGTVSFTALAGGQRLAVEGLQHLELPAGRRLVVRLGDHLRREDLALLVVADRSVVVQRDIYAVGRPGLAAAVGVPLR